MSDAGVDTSLSALLEKSASADVRTLLGAKEKARRAMIDDPSAGNLAAFEKASRLLDAAKASKAKPAAAEDEEPTILQDYRAVLEYVAGQGRKLAKTKLYGDVNRGRLKKQPDGSFKVRDVDRYLVSLPTTGTPDGMAEKAADRQRRKEEADIRKAEAQAKREEFQLATLQGKFLPREQIAGELAVRAVALRDGLKNAMESAAADIVEIVAGDPKQTAALVEYMGRMFDRSLGEYARPLDIVVEFSGIESAASDEEDA